MHVDPVQRQLDAAAVLLGLADQAVHLWVVLAALLHLDRTVGEGQGGCRSARGHSSTPGRRVEWRKPPHHREVKQAAIDKVEGCSMARKKRNASNGLPEPA